MIVLVTGGRHYSDRGMVYVTLDKIHAETPITLLVHGDAPGADTLADEWAEKNEVPKKPCPANWFPNGPQLPMDRSAGPKRNSFMLTEYQPDLLVAFPGDNGTMDMIKKARAKKIPVQPAGWILPE